MSPAFLAVIREEMEHIGGGVHLLNLEDAAANLSSGRCRVSGAEVDRKTKGQPFRLDTPDGPLFVWDALWRFAGRCGSVLGGPLRRPNWKGDSRDFAGDEAALGQSPWVRVA